MEAEEPESQGLRWMRYLVCFLKEMETPLAERSHLKPRYGKIKAKGMCLSGAQGQPSSAMTPKMRDSLNK